VTGPISLSTAAGARSAPSKAVLILPPLPPEPNPDLRSLDGLIGTWELSAGSARDGDLRVDGGRLLRPPARRH
jgi:hypothetical protein